MGEHAADGFLEERLIRYDRWVREGRIPFSSKVIPVRESLTAQSWVLPTEQVFEFLRNARSFALTDCVCRSHYRRCENPVEVCFLINDAADACVARGKGRYVCLAEAERALRRANERGLVHLAVYNPDQYVYAVCSCCTCCCHDLQFLKLYARDDLVVHSDYVALTDMEACVHCGDCIERCAFGARAWQDRSVKYLADACYGCGLCMTICPKDAVVLRRR